MSAGHPTNDTYPYMIPIYIYILYAVTISYPLLSDPPPTLFWHRQPVSYVNFKSCPSL